MKGYVVFDLEATCYDRNAGNTPKGFSNEIIEIGAVRFDREGNETGRFSEFCRPKKHPVISDFCNSLTTITQSDIDVARSADEVIREFFDWAGGHTLVSWGHYDKNQLIHDTKLNGITDDKGLLRNHRSIKHLYQKWTGDKKAIGVKWVLQKEAMTFDGTQHRGIDDAINISKIFLKYLPLIERERLSGDVSYKTIFDHSAFLKYVGLRPGYGYVVEDMYENRIQFNLYGCSLEQFFKAIEYCVQNNISYWANDVDDKKESHKRRVILIQKPDKPRKMTREEIAEVIIKHTSKKKKRSKSD